MITFYFNNKHSIQEEIFLKDRPILPVAEEDKKHIEVLQRVSGTLTMNTGNYKDIEIPLNIRAITNEYRATYDNVLNWINNIQNRELIFSTDMTKAYTVKDVKISNIKALTKCMDFTLTFRCEPFISVANNMQKAIKVGVPFEVRTDLDCPCIIELNNVLGVDELNFTINNKPFTIYKPIGDIIIDSNIDMCYKKETYTYIQTSSNFPMLKNGTNVIECNDKDLILHITIKPLWRY